MIYNDGEMKIVDYRHKDIALGNGSAMRNKDTLYFLQYDKDKGLPDTTDKTLSDLDAEVAIVFQNIEDVDNLINQLFEIRKTFLPIQDN
ncbi:MAG: hypothetical protein ACYDG2_22125 [Ruminiclostridium sp.]